MADNIHRSVSCKEIHEQITAYVDNRVDEQEYRSKVQQHIRFCPDCRAAYELELTTKMVVRDRAQRAAAPDALRKAISSQVDSLSRERAAAGRPGGVRESWLDRFANYFLSPVGIGVALVLIVVGAWVVLDPGSTEGRNQIIVDSGGADTGAATPAEAAAENFFNKAAKNFEAIQAGSLTVQHTTKDAKELLSYFRENGIRYNVDLIPVRATLAGGTISEHRGRQRFAHIVYVSGDTIIYIFEVPQSELKDGDVVYVTQDVLNQLNQGKVFWEEPGTDVRLVMFQKGDLVFAVASNVPRPAMERMLAIR